MVVGVCSAGFTTVQHPAARAGAIFQVAISKGKFQGIIWPTTPRGSWRLMLIVLASCSEMELSSARIAPAKYLKWSTHKGKSAARVSRSAFPLSTVSALASISRFSSMMSAIFNNILLRVAAGVTDQEGNASWAASSAFSMSCLFPLAALVNGLPSIGLMLSKYSPLLGATHLPPMKWSYWGLKLGRSNAFRGLVIVSIMYFF